MPEQTDQVAPVSNDPLEPERVEILDLEAELASLRAARTATIEEKAVEADRERLEKQRNALLAEIEYEKQANALLARARGEEVPTEEVPAEVPAGAAPSGQSSPVVSRVGQAGPSSSPSTSVTQTPRADRTEGE